MVIYSREKVARLREQYPAGTRICLNSMDGEAGMPQGLEGKPTAIFAMNDLMATGFMDAALNDGVRIPEDVSVIGFDNRQECRFTRPRLTTVDIPLEKKSRL